MELSLNIYFQRAAFRELHIKSCIRWDIKEDIFLGYNEGGILRKLHFLAYIIMKLHLVSHIEEATCRKLNKEA